MEKLGIPLQTRNYIYDLFIGGKIGSTERRDNYKPLDPIKGIWHPVIQDECAKMNAKYTVNKRSVQQEDLDAEALDQIEGSDEFLSDWNQFLKGEKVS